MPLRALNAATTIRLHREVLRPRRPMWRARLPRQLPPGGVIVDYYRTIRGYAERAHRMVDAQVIPRLPAIVAEAAARRSDADEVYSGPRMDSLDAFDEKVERRDREANELIDRISKDYFEDLKTADLERRALMTGERTSTFQRQQFSKQVRAAFGVDVFSLEPRVGARVGDFVTENVALIKTVPNQYFDQVETVITRGVRQGARHEDLAKEIERRFDVARGRAQVIARDQVLTLFGDVNRARQEAIGVKRYVWRTVSDSRVRPEHEERDGQSFDWDDPPDDGHPSEAVLCRCWAEPDFSEIIGRL